MSFFPNQHLVGRKSHTRRARQRKRQQVVFRPRIEELEGRWLPSTLHWIGGHSSTTDPQGSHWSDPLNWAENKAPVNGQDLVFARGQPSLDDIAGLRLGMITLQNGVTVNGGAGVSLTLTGGVTSIGGGASLSNTFAVDTQLSGSQAIQVARGTSLVLQSNITVNAGTLTVPWNGLLKIDAGSLTIDAGATLNDGGPLLINQGSSFNGAGTLTVQKTGRFDDIGTATVGTLQLYGQLQVTGSFVANGVTNLFAGSAFYDSGATSVASSGSWISTGGSSIYVSSAGGAATFTVEAGGSLMDSGVITVSNGNIFTTAGKTTVETGGTFIINGGGMATVKAGGAFEDAGTTAVFGSFDNAGTTTVDVGGSFNQPQGSVTVVDKGGTFNDLGQTTVKGDLKVAGSWNLQPGGSFNNNGTMEVSGQVTVSAGDNFINTATITLQTGSTFLDHGQTIVAPGALFDVSGLATVIGGASFGVGRNATTGSRGTLMIESSGVISVAGNLQVQGTIQADGDLSVEAGGVVNLGPGSMFYDFNQGIGAHLTVEVHSAGTLVVAGAGISVPHGGSVTDTGSIVLASLALFENRGGTVKVDGAGSFQVQGGATLEVDYGGSFDDAGKCTVNAGGLVKVDNGGSFDVAGFCVVNAGGSVELSDDFSASTLVVDANGKFYDYGTVKVDRGAKLDDDGLVFVFLKGVVDDQGNFGVTGAVTCNGTFNLESGQTLYILPGGRFDVTPIGDFTDAGTITTDPGGFTDEGTFDGAFSMRVAAPTAASVSVPFSLTVTMLTRSNTVANLFYGDSVDFHSTDPAIVGLPASYTFSTSDNGVHTVMGVVLKTPGPQNITVSFPYDTNLTGTVKLTVSSLAESLSAIAARPTTGVPPFPEGLATTVASNPSSAIYVSSAASTVAQSAPAFASLPTTMNPTAPLAAGTAASLDDNHVDNFFARAQIARRHTPVASPRQRTTSSEDWLVL
jgi:fibronectin-binding autotransporter adhesin